MKRTIFSLSLLYSTFSLGQTSNINTCAAEQAIGMDSLYWKKGAMPNIFGVVKKESKVDLILDIINGYLSENEEQAIPISDTTKIIMVKEKKICDILNYIFPIITLILGSLWNEYCHKINDKRRIKKSGNRWVAELRSLEEPINHQIKALNQFLGTFTDDDFQIPPPSIYPFLNGDVFKSLDKNDLLSFIERNNKNNDFKEIVKISNKTNGFISSLSELHSKLREKFEKFMTKTDEYTINLQKFNEPLADYFNLVEKKCGEDCYNLPNYKPMADLYSKYIMAQEDSKFNPFLLEKEFFLPLLTHIFTNLRYDERIKPLRVSITESLNNIKNLKLEREYIKESVVKITEMYEKQLMDLNSIVKQILNIKK
ncbi:hypothetical protein SAMD00024442_1_7 [Candidatus Symbiothrix dinenymphae]|nr:hypothetical protein SAMD00024442_1_7 [Candidatus Symbiothrix dinenymphae]